MKRSLEVKIIRDTREQTPFTFKQYPEVYTYVDKLDAGDYSLCGHDMPNDDYSVVIERKKTCLELASNLGQNWDRFLREMELLKDYKIKVLVVCEKNNFYKIYKEGRTKLHPNFIRKRLLYLQIKYGINFMFFPDQDCAEEYVVKLFKEILTITEEEN